VGGPACKFKEVRGLLTENGSAEPWILDLTAEKAVDRAVHPVHGSTVDRTKGYPPDLIRTVCEGSHSLGRVRARNGGARAGDRGGAAALRRRIAGVP
jgi:hypothetical protein